MARLPRLTVAGCLHHAIQRGNNRQPIVASVEDHDTLLGLLAEHARKFGVAVHAYVLMPNHFHLLATPETADGLPLLMQAVGRRYVRYFNDAQGRSGTLWEGRYRANVLQPERYLLAGMAYLDLNPVRAGLAEQPAEYRWSSHGHYLGARHDRLVTPHPLLWTLGNTPFAREAQYAEMVRTGVSMETQLALTQSALGGWALGDAAFMADLQKRTERRLLKAQPGRPTSLPK